MLTKIRPGFAREVSFSYDDWKQEDRRAFMGAIPDDLAGAPDGEFADSPGDCGDLAIDRDQHRNVLFATERYMAFVKQRRPDLLGLPLKDRFGEQSLKEFCSFLPNKTNEQKRTQRDYLTRLMRVHKALTGEDTPVWQLDLIESIGYVASAPKPSPLSTKAVREIGISAMKQAQKDLKEWRRKNSRRPYIPQACVDYRDGLFVAILALLLLRMGNMLDAKIGKTFFERTTNTPYEILVINWKSKRHKKILRRIPHVLQTYVDFYLDIIRPELLQGETSDIFWIDRQRTALGYGGGYLGFIRTIRRAADVHMNPHLVRRAGADVLRGIGAPDAAISEMLGHAELQTAPKFYISLQRVARRDICAKITGA
ncbi:tyrosine-type recombinase/integrase [uncultured Rhodoblastus sp.]|uniref:tyrosine-type recombinase/integrase n=1 Tax=uncultured Rhodoblastus sp. TaxID=543037 RepID=UPI0025E0EC79|nr:tyrosine-type recombinase/integrase [uncultured Rhodoblastus sp.]